MWKLVKTEIDYNILTISIVIAVSIISSFVFILISPENSFFLVDVLEFFVITMPLLVLIILVFVHLIEKRDRFQKLLPVKSKYIALSRVIFLLFPFFIILAANFTAIFSLTLIKNIGFLDTQMFQFQFQRIFDAGITIVLAAITLILIDVFHLMSIRKKSIRFIVVLLLASIFVLTAFISFIISLRVMFFIIEHNTFKDRFSDLYIVLGTNVFVYFGIILSFISISIYKLRRFFA